MAKRGKKVLPKKSEQSESNVASSSLPLPVKLISIIYFIASFFFLISGIFVLVVSYYAITDPNALLTLPSMDANQSIIENLSNYGIIISLGFILVSIIDFLGARGLLKRKRWALNLVILISFFGTFNSLIRIGYGFYSNILNLIVHVSIVYYLFKNKKMFS